MWSARVGKGAEMALFLNCNAGNSRPAARVGDNVSCAKHGTVTIVSGSPDTFYNDQPVARVGDKTSCGATIIEGSDSVYINGKPAAYVGCATTHLGRITSGSPDVFIGKAEEGRNPDQCIEPFSMSIDLSIMHEAGNHNNESYGNIAVEITKPDGTYLTTVGTDEHGISRRFYTKEQEDVVAWVDFGHWDVSEEFESMDWDDGEEGE
jgi:uncharacterized Zn-binding protein involved in type VI secretion